MNRVLYLLLLLGTAYQAAAQEPNAHEQGRDIYNFRCYYCHGYSGDAKTLATTYLPTPPRNFQKTTPDELSREQMIRSVTHGVPNTAMAGFGEVISAREIELVVDFVRREFMEQGALNTRYHIDANGWPDHERYRSAYPFATGEIALDTPWGELTAEQQEGKRLFLESCVSCHDRARVEDEGPVWDLRALSYPRTGFDHRAPLDGITEASVYAKHDEPPRLTTSDPVVLEGAALFQENCAFCHGADGTGKNWIGSFLEPHPRDLTDPAFMAGMTEAMLMERIRKGLPGTSMPAWQHVLKEAEIRAIIRFIDEAFHPVKEGS